MKDQVNIGRIRYLAILLDSKFKGPFGIAIGLDGILGFIPIVGDFVTTGLSLWIIIAAAQLGCGPSTLVRMGINVFIENLVDMVPFVGNFFDIYWKSNLKNLALLEDHLRDPRVATWKSRLAVGLICFSLLTGLALLAALTIKVVTAVVGYF